MTAVALVLGMVAELGGVGMAAGVVVVVAVTDKAAEPVVDMADVCVEVCGIVERHLLRT